MQEPVDFKNGSVTLRGVLHSAGDARQNGVGVIFLHGWSGCRLGPHRMFVKTARRLAERGYDCLRFDFGGRGESDAGSRDATIKSMIADTKSAQRFLTERRAVQKTVLLGICSGGKVAIGAAADEPGVDGLVLWSAEAMGDLRSPSTDRRKSLHNLKQYWRKLMCRQTWQKILSRQINTRLVGKALLQHEAPSKEERIEETAVLNRFHSYQGRILFVYGSNDPDTRLAAEAYRSFAVESQIDNEFHEIEGANHSFYGLHWELEVMDITEEWLAGHFAQ